MPWRRLSLPALSLALPLFVLTSRVARAQEAPASPSPSGSAEPTPAPSPARPPLISPVPASAGPAPVSERPTVTVINPSRDPLPSPASGAPRSDSGELAAGPTEVFSEDWWGRARPVIELHGFFRTRAELFQNFSLGRRNSSFQSNDPQFLWPIPLDQSYTPLSGAAGATVALCGPATPLPNQRTAPTRRNRGRTSDLDWIRRFTSRTTYASCRKSTFSTTSCSGRRPIRLCDSTRLRR
jgi:hypothetical protein